MKKRYLFGVWEPDAVEIAGDGKIGVSQCENVIPVTRGYKTIPGWARATNGTNDITGSVASYTSIIGAISVRNENGNTIDFISDTTTVYKADFTAGTLTSLGSVGTALPLGQDCFRDFAQYGRYVVMASSGNSTGARPQYFDTSSSTAFATLTTEFYGRTVGVLRDFVVFGDTEDTADGRRRTRVRWSAFGDLFTWTPSAATQSDFQDLLSNSGAVIKIVGGNEAFVVCTNAIYLMTYVGPPVVMRFDLIAPRIGTFYPQSCVRVGEHLYMYSTAGFVRVGTQPGDVTYIGAGRVNEEFFYLMSSNASSDGHIRCTGYLDAANQCIGWQYSRADAGRGDAVCYHWPSDRWVKAGDRDGAAFIYSSDLSTQITVSGADVQQAPTAHALAADGNLYAQNDANKPARATLGTGFEELVPGQRALVERVYLLAESRDATLSDVALNVASIPNSTIPVNIAEGVSGYQSVGTWQTEGFWTITGAGGRDGRFHKFTVYSTTGARTPNDQYLGLEVVFHPRGEY